MSLGERRTGIRDWRPRMTIRARLTLTYTTMITTIGAVMVAIIYIFMRYVPTYQIMAPGDSVGPSISPTTPGGGGSNESAGATSSIAIRSQADVLDALLVISIIALVVLAFAGAIIGWIVAGRVLKPLQAINRAAQLAGTGSFDHRVGFDGPHDEVRELSDTFDDMLAKLDNAFQANRRFAANASHELSTPLATTQTMLDVALSDPDLDLPALRTVAGRVHETNRRNIEIVDSLLTLAEVGSGDIRWERADIAQIVAEILPSVLGEANARDIEIHDDLASAPTLCDAQLVRQAVTNLLLNAVRHNVDGGTVEVKTSPTKDGGASLRVANTGSVLSPRIVGSLTEPFVRGAGRVAAQSGPRGHGLGLAIVQSVAQVHKATLTLVPNVDGGLTVSLLLSPPEHGAAGSPVDEPATGSRSDPAPSRSRS